MQNTEHEEGTIMKLKSSLAKANEMRRIRALLVTITAKVINSSSSTITSGKIAFQDSSGSGDPVVATIEFGTIASKQTATKTTSLPTGFEVVLTDFIINGEHVTNGGFGNNATEVELTITD